MTRLPETVHAANVAGLEATQPKKVKVYAPDNNPELKKVIEAYRKAEVAGDKVAMEAMQDAYCYILDREI